MANETVHEGGSERDTGAGAGDEAQQRPKPHQGKPDGDLARLLRVIAGSVEAGIVDWSTTKQMIAALAEAEHGRAVAEVDRDLLGGDLEREVADLKARLATAHRAAGVLAKWAIDLSGIDPTEVQAPGDLATAAVELLTHEIDTSRSAMLADIGADVDTVLYRAWEKGLTLGRHGALIEGLYRYHRCGQLDEMVAHFGPGKEYTPNLVNAAERLGRVDIDELLQRVVATLEKEAG